MYTLVVKEGGEDREYPYVSNHKIDEQGNLIINFSDNTKSTINRHLYETFEVESVGISEDYQSICD